jgi:hypothetical protein
MCKKRLHVITPDCPCAAVESILQAFTPRAHKFSIQNLFPYGNIATTWHELSAQQGRRQTMKPRRGWKQFPRRLSRHGIDAWTIAG